MGASVIMAQENIVCTRKVSEIRTPIREISTRARELKGAGMKVYPLNIGDPNKFDFETPAYLQQALKGASGAGWYSDSEGHSDLLKAISDWVNLRYGTGLKPTDFIVTTGISEGVEFLMKLFLDPGDECLLPGPGFPQYEDHAKFYGGNPVFYKCDEANGWQPDLDDIRSKPYFIL